MILFLFQLQSLAQSKDFEKFTLLGRIADYDTGKLILTAGFITEDYIKPFKPQSTSIKKGKFSFQGSINYPEAARVLFNPNSNNPLLSSLFFIRKGTQTVSFDTDSFSINPILNNGKESREYKNCYLKKMTDVTMEESNMFHKIDSLYNFYNNKLPDKIEIIVAELKKLIQRKKDSVLINYVKQYPDSYVSMWLLVERFCMNGYNEMYYQAANLLSKRIKELYTTKQLIKKFQLAKQTDLGNILPLKYIVTNKNALLFNSIKHNKYTLIDFWYSHCGPCLEQFPEFKTIYLLYKKSGFEIASISVDQKKDEQNFKDIIKKYGLHWQQFWDINGNKSRGVSINSFPTNFLLDSNGIIIKKNISPSQLELFLKEEFNKF